MRRLFTLSFLFASTIACFSANAKDGKLTVIHVAIASEANKHFEVQIRPAGDRSQRRQEIERRVRDCAERETNRGESFHVDLKFEVFEAAGELRKVAIKTKYPKALSPFISCVKDDIKARLPSE